jgi:hypothetical protein
MPLKTRQGTESAFSDPFAGPWGRVNSDAFGAQTVRFQKTDKWAPKTYSYPYRSFSRWEFRKSYSSDEIIIYAATDTITITGKNLERLAEALDQGKLELVREMGSESSVSDSPITVSSISVKGLT